MLIRQWKNVLYMPTLADPGFKVFCLVLCFNVQLDIKMRCKVLDSGTSLSHIAYYVPFISTYKVMLV